MHRVTTFVVAVALVAARRRSAQSGVDDAGCASRDSRGCIRCGSRHMALGRSVHASGSILVDGNIA